MVGHVLWRLYYATRRGAGAALQGSGGTRAGGSRNVKHGQTERGAPAAVHMTHEHIIGDRAVDGSVARLSCIMKNIGLIEQYHSGHAELIDGAGTGEMRAHAVRGRRGRLSRDVAHGLDGRGRIRPGIIYGDA